MSDLLALDIAILPPPDVSRRALQLSAALPEGESQGLRLDEAHLPHVTLTQHFVSVGELPAVFGCLDDILRGQPPLSIHVTGGGKTLANTVWMAIECTEALAALHARVMDALHQFERFGSGRDAFFDPDPRVADLAWVAGYRMKSSLSAYTPHITLGHASDPPHIEPFTFEATEVAACHLGRFCTCRRVLRRWELRTSQ